MHYHVINEVMETEKEKDVIEEDRQVAQWLFEYYMAAAALSKLNVKATSRWDWKVENPTTKEWVSVKITECNQVH